jgi:diguanylate cyclase (GGDEF)-like protein/PAS domain S-box-containing protein
MKLAQLIEPSVSVFSATMTVDTAVSLIQKASSPYLLVEHGQGFSLVTSQALLQTIASIPHWQGVELQAVPSILVEALSITRDVELPWLLDHFQQCEAPALPVIDQHRQVVGLLVKSTVLERSAQAQASATSASAAIAPQNMQIMHKEVELERLMDSLQEKQDMLNELELSLLHNEAALQQSQTQIDSILDSIEDVVWSIQANTLQILYINASTLNVYGRPTSEFIQNRDLWYQVIHPDDQEQAQKTFQDIYVCNDQDYECRIICPNGEIRWVRTRAHLKKDADGTPLRIDGITSDITERRQIQEQLRYDALHDKLTGLANRNLLGDRITQAFRHSERNHQSSFAVLFLDLDRFKVINDSLGHQAGDQILIATAERLRSCQRDVDTVSRLGGDEFVVVLENIENCTSAIKIAERIHQVLSEPILLNGHDIAITTSIGIAFGANEFLKSEDPVAEILRDADTAMYRAKAAGTGHYAIFDSSMHRQAVAELRLETDLRRVLQGIKSSDSYTSELVVYYQPIFSLESAKICGFEALVRWQHPTKGLIPPADFLGLAEVTGQISMIDCWVLETACRQLKLWQKQFPSLAPLSINVNLSSKHFNDSDLIEFLDQTLKKTGVQGHQLKLEITETVIISNPEKANVVLQQLQDRQIQVCLDDFGTGYSSLSYLHNFPFNNLKIDRSFIQHLDQFSEKKSNKEVVRTIINLGNILGMDIVAEGIETLEQFDYLRSLKCQYGQGYFFSPPINVVQMTDFLKSQVIHFANAASLG